MLRACPVCESEFDPMTGGYAPDARIVCGPCAEKLKNSRLNAAKEEASSTFPGSIGSVLIALASFIVQNRFIFFLFPLMAIGFGLGTAWTAFSHPNARERLRWKRVPTMVFGVLGAGLGVLSLAIQLMFSGD
jgi:hypothetical protein